MLFIEDTEDPSCPLVFCEGGRYRVLNDRVFDNPGSPVQALIEEDAGQRVIIVVSAGITPSEFQTVRFPSPPFDELIQNPEVGELLKSLNMSEEEARRRYDIEAPAFIEMKQGSSTQGDPNDIGPSTAEPSPGAPISHPNSTPAEALPLIEFVEATETVAKRSTRTPVDQRSVDPAAKIVAARATPEQPEPTVSPFSVDSVIDDSAESKAFEQNDNNPVIRRR